VIGKAGDSILAPEFWQRLPLRKCDAMFDVATPWAWTILGKATIVSATTILAGRSVSPRGRRQGA